MGKCVQRLSFVVLLWLVFVPDVRADGDTVASLSEEFWDARLAYRPTMATDFGDHRFDDRLDDLSEEGREAYGRRIRDIRERARRLRPFVTDAGDRFDLELLSRALRDAMARVAIPEHYMPFDPLDGVHLKLPLLLVSQPFKNRADFDNYVARLRAFPKQIDDVIRNARTGIMRNLVQPRAVLRRCVPQIRGQLVRTPEKSEMYKAAQNLDVLPEAERDEVRDALRAAIAEDVLPAYARLLAFLEDEALPAARDTAGIGHLPQGAEMYQALANLHMTVNMPVDEVHRLGLAEVERIRREMDAIRKELGYDGELSAFINHMREDPDQRFRTEEELVAAADALLARAKSGLPALFGRLPQADCVMKEIEAFREASSPAAYYGPVPADGSRPGYYYINTYRPDERLRFTLEALTYHESVPGHHLQIALDVENDMLPKFRKYYGNATAYVEGWALYAEKLGYEMGGYDTPAARYGQLTFEMWRACRLVVDTGIHGMGWTRQQAIDFMLANSSLSPLDIEAEVDRYITWPGQALAYKVGEIRLLNLRSVAEEKLGDRFDVRAFHDALLSGGAMPIDMLERRMEAWIKKQADR